MDKACIHPKHYGSGDMRTCANPQCAVWLVSPEGIGSSLPDAEPVTEADAPPVAQTEETVTITATGKGKRRGKR